MTSLAKFWNSSPIVVDNNWRDARMTPYPTRTTDAKDKTMTITRAANELESIRNNRTSTRDELQNRVDAVGQWLATQKYSAKVGKLLGECHSISDCLEGGSGKGGVRIAFA